MLINSLIFIVLQEDIFTLEVADLGTIHKIKLRHDNAMLNPVWFVERVAIEGLTAIHNSCSIVKDGWRKIQKIRKLKEIFMKMITRFWSDFSLHANIYMKRK